MKNIISVILGLLVVLFSATISGTVLWLVWPLAIPLVFPGLVESGVLVAHIPWYAAVFLSWVFSILVKSSTSSKTQK